MKAGDVCRCISDFTGISAEELTLYKNDIVQVHEVVDRYWLRGEGGGSIGLVPSNVVVKVNDLPPHPPHQPLFVASAEFLPSQPGDLGLFRGDFVVGLNPIDESWWCGESWGKKGIFPINFVWRINEDIIQVEDTSEKAVRLVGRVKTSLRAQLPEELDLYAGDLVNITHIVDKDWYRGESNGSTGIFPKNFVDLVEGSSVPSSPVVQAEESSFMVSDAPSSFSLTGGTSGGLPSAASHHNGTAAHPPPAESVPPPLGCASSSAHRPMGSEASLGAMLAPAQAPAPTPQPEGKKEPAVRLSNISSAWKTIDGDDDDLFDDDYFRQNMPGLFSSKGGSSSVPSAHTSDTSSALSPASGASVSLPVTGSRYENVPVSLPPGEPSHAPPSLHCVREEQPDKYRYENIPGEAPPGPGKHVDGVGGRPELSAFLEKGKMNSLSRKVEDYLSSSFLGQSDADAGTSPAATHAARAWPYKGPSYTEDNTGIEPYGRAVFSFKAQYPNELTFRKGEIVHLLQHVDSHWTLGRAGDAKGIFPTSYVDIIVDCLHSEEQHFLARPEAAPVASPPVWAVAQYDFEAAQAGDVSMRKGDTLTLLKEVDTNWVIVENTTGSKGMCPKNYLSFQDTVEAPEAREPQSHTPDSTAPDTMEERSRESEQDSVHQRSRSSSPFSPSWQRRSYNKEDFGCIKRQDVEPVLAKNIASLDATSKAAISHTEKRGGESVFMQREASPAEDKRETEGQQSTVRSKPVIPARQSKMPPVQAAATTDAADECQEKTNSSPRALCPPTPTTAATPSPAGPAASAATVLATTTPPASMAVTTTTPSPAGPATSAATVLATATPAATTATTAPPRPRSLSSTKPRPPPLIPPRTRTLTVSSSLQCDSAAALVLRPPPSPPQPKPRSLLREQPQAHSPTYSSPNSQPQPLSQNDSSSQPQPQPSSPLQQPSKHPASSQPQPQPKTPSQPVYSQVNRSPRKTQETEEARDTASGVQQMNDSVNTTASFPDDVSQLSVASEAAYSAENSLGSSSSGLVPHRPAPPPPPKLPDLQDQEEQYYSLPPCGKDATPHLTSLPPHKLPDLQGQEEQYYSLTPREEEAMENQSAGMEGVEQTNGKDEKDINLEGEEVANVEAAAVPRFTTPPDQSTTNNCQTLTAPEPHQSPPCQCLQTVVFTSQVLNA